jgi:hypothetical protein
MENIVMRYFREIYGYTPVETAHRLGISVDDYLNIETGEQLLSESRAEQLVLLFNLRKGLLLEAAEQLDLLLARKQLLLYKRRN